MDMNLYLKKIFTLAYRITGDKKIACELALSAIMKVVDTIELDDKISDCVYKTTAIQVCNLFLNNHNIHFNDFNYKLNSNLEDRINVIQRTLLKMEPVSRVVIVWKDILGFQLSDLLIIVNININELNITLSNARKQLLGKII